VRTNYVLAGLLIERITGTPYARQVERRIIGPLRLRGTSMPGMRVDLPNPYAHGYLAYTHQGQRKVIDISLVNPSWAGASGEIISTTKDLDTFISALLGGRLLKPELLAEMLTMRDVVPGFGYGLGLVRADFDERCGGTLFGHDSGGLGYSTLVLSRADRTKRYEVSATIGNVDITDPAEQQRLFTALQRVHDAALCGAG
jgi:D-alanyl-D-alanine carboxypeptidase